MVWGGGNTGSGGVGVPGDHPDLTVLSRREALAGGHVRRVAAATEGAAGARAGGVGRPGRPVPTGAPAFVLQGPPHKCALIFADNSGVDVILGVFPFVRELLSRGTEVSGAGAARAGSGEQGELPRGAKGLGARSLRSATRRSSWPATRARRSMMSPTASR